MKLRLSLTLTLSRDQPAAEDVTVDLVGTHHIPAAGHEGGFRPVEGDPT